LRRTSLWGWLPRRTFPAGNRHRERWHREKERKKRRRKAKRKRDDRERESPRNHRRGEEGRRRTVKERDPGTGPSTDGE
jgi:hypothetical protein